jgi:hypothetical protein
MKFFLEDYLSLKVHKKQQKHIFSYITMLVHEEASSNGQWAWPPTRLTKNYPNFTHRLKPLSMTSTLALDKYALQVL